MAPAEAAEAAKEAARTVPPREHGGNCDIKNLTRGSKVYFPVYVEGGGLSMGDLHFSKVMERSRSVVRSRWLAILIFA